MNSFVVSTPSALPELASSSIPVAGRADLRPQNINDAVIRLAGNSQDGIQTAGAFLARLAGRSSQDVMTYMTIPSTISGGPSIFQVRIGTGEVLSAGDEADFLVAFYQHSYDEHVNFLKEGGVLLYDSDNVQPNLDTSASSTSASRSPASRSRRWAARQRTRARTSSSSG